MKPKKIPGAPQQIKGSCHDTESKKKVEDNQDIEKEFNILKQRFFAINHWRKYCADSSTDFKLCNSSGQIVDRLPEIGDFIRIDIPGPGSSAGKSYDWVEIIQIDTDIPDRVMIQCRPSRCPLKESRKIAHFYSCKATSTFVVSKGKDFVQAGIYGRNEYPNLKSGFIDSIRNIMIAIGGMFGFSKIQWKCLANGLVDFESEPK